VNPIGGISKLDLRRFLAWGTTHLGYPALADVVAAEPTAELEPLRDGIKPQARAASL
jgi:NAD+ synthase (glutamine-hydrolysing)